MPKLRAIQNSFNAGEWSALMEGRADLEKYGKAVKRLENLVIDPRGPAVYRPGLRYIAGTKTDASLSRVLPFIFSAETAYVIEFGAAYARFYKDQVQIEDGGSPVEVVMPYAAADLAELKYCQSADVFYLFHPDYPTRKLSRTSDTEWVTTEINFRPGPTYEEPVFPAATLTLSAVTGLGVTFTAGASVFQSGDVGRTIISGAGRASIVDFTSGTVVLCDVIDDFASVGSIAADSWQMQGSPTGELTPSSAGPVGSITTLTSTGTSEAIVNLLEDPNDHWTASGSGTNEYYIVNTAPFYTAVKPSKVFENDVDLVEGSVGTLGIAQWDFGDNDALGYDTIYIRLTDGADPDSKAAADESFVKMSTATTTTDLFRSTDVGKYIRILSGFVKITSYTSALIVKGEILKELTEATATVNWTLESEMWSSTNGYPSCGVFFENRLFVAGSPAFPETVWGSVSGDYENFTPGTDDADSIQFSLASRQISVIRWLEPRDYLIVGCIGGEWRVGPEDTGAPLTPLNVVAKEQRTNGCANILPISIDGSTLFLQRAERKIREFTFQFESDGYKAPDLTLLAGHISLGGIKEMAFQQSPLSILWCVRDDGKLLGLTYMRDQDVVGWHIHKTDGEVENIAVIPGDGYDELWAVIKRTVDGSTVRYVEMLEAFFEDENATFKANNGLNAFFVDSGVTYNGAATTTITGLDHLEGKTVVGLADAALITDKVVESGQITLDEEASVVHVGLPYTGLLETMRFDARLQDGTAQGEKKRIFKMKLRVNESGVFKAGRDENDLQVVSAQVVNDTNDEGFSFVVGEAPDLFTGDIEMVNNSRWDRAGRLTIVQDNPLPLTLIAIMPEVST